MKIIENKFIPPRGFIAIMLFGVIFTRDRSRIDPVTINHEAIHLAQMKETLYLGFYIIYLAEYILQLFRQGFNSKKAYMAIRFEIEAFAHEKDLEYLKYRPSHNYKIRNCE